MKRIRICIKPKWLIVIILIILPALRSEIMATYLLHGIVSPTPLSSISDIESTEGWSDQPTLKWPADDNDKPNILSEGVRFKNDKYLEFSTHFDNQGSDYISVNIWLHREFANIPGNIITIANNFTNNGYAQGVGQVSLNTIRTSLLGVRNYVYVNGEEVDGIVELMDYGEWVCLGFGWGKNEGYFKRKTHTSGYGATMNHPISSWTASDKMYIGCYQGVCDLFDTFKVHSIRVYSDKLPASSNDLYNAVYNRWYSFCSSGTKESLEQCDDGNYNKGDGCSETCTIEANWNCSGGTTSSLDTCSDICGDGKNPQSSNVTTCDDGGEIDGDGCASDCTVEDYYICSGGSPNTPDTCTPSCAASTAPPNQNIGCLDRNIISGDGCSSNCKVETGYSCPWNTTNLISICVDKCGDGTTLGTTPPTYCDDSNLTDGDGCSSDCKVEKDWVCSGGSPTSKDTCSDICGDGKVMKTASGYCDDGNKNDDDGCSSTCQVETGWECTLGDSATASSCSETCGDGIVINPLTGYCDDGDKISGDGCNSICQVEPGWSCTLGDSTTQSSCSDICGDGTVMDPKHNYCDDGNINGDGCSSTCHVENEWECTLGDAITSSTCTDKCADGIVVDPKIGYCDDGNAINGDGCDSSCNVEPNVDCTLGDLTTASKCTDICGDGFVSVSNLPSQYCDDGNKHDGDGCSSSCERENGWICTEGSTSNASVCIPIPTQNGCKKLNCKVCSTDSSQMCTSCNNGFQLLQDGTCREVQISSNVQAISTGVQAMNGAGILVAAVSSLLNSSSPCAIWSMANQLQLLLLLLLTQSSLPANVRGYIANNSMFSFSMDFSFLPLKTNFLSKIPLDWMKKEQTNIGLVDIGQESGSSFNNNFSLMFSFILGFLFHCFLFCLPRKLDHEPKNIKQRFIKFFGGLWKAFTFGFYLRFILEAYQNILLSGINELNNYEFSSLSSIISTAISAFFLILLMFIACLAIIQIFTASDSEEHSKCGELITGLKSTKPSKAYTTVLILRRILFCTWLIIFEHLGNTIIVIGMVAVQFCYALYVLITRPFQEKVSNLIEGINEVFFTAFVMCLLKFNSENTWSEKASSMYILSMVGNNLVIVSIIFTSSIAGLVKKCIPSKPTTSRFTVQEVSASDIRIQRSSIETNVAKSGPSRIASMAQARKNASKFTSRDRRVMHVPIENNRPEI